MAKQIGRILWLKKAISLAEQLGFWDDVAIYKAELKKLENEG